MNRYYSYHTRTEERKNTRSTFLFLFLTLVVITLAIFVGIPTLIQFASFLTNINKSSQSADVKDNIPPPPPSINLLPDTTNNTKLEVSGSSEPGATIKIFFNGVNEETIVNSSGKFILDLNLKDGENTIYAIASDQSGNESQKTQVLKVTLDKTPPDIEITSPQDGANFSGPKQKQIYIKGNTKVGASLSINDRFTLVQDDGSFTYVATLTDGENNFDIKSVDKAGNSSEKTLKVYYNL